MGCIARRTGGRHVCQRDRGRRRERAQREDGGGRPTQGSRSQKEPAAADQEGFQNGREQTEGCERKRAWHRPAEARRAVEGESLANAVRVPDSDHSTEPRNCQTDEKLRGAWQTTSQEQQHDGRGNQAERGVEHEPGNAEDHAERQRALGRDKATAADEQQRGHAGSEKDCQHHSFKLSEQTARSHFLRVSHVTSLQQQTAPGARHSGCSL